MEISEIIINEDYHGLNPVVFGRERCEPSHSFGPAVRTYWLLHYVVSGKGRFVREGKTYYLGKGDIFVIPPMLETYYEADKNDPWHYIWIGFTASDIPKKVLDKPVLHLPLSGRIFQDMKRCSELEGGRSAYLSSRLWELMSMLLDEGSGSAGHIEKALSIIHSEYANGITVTELSHRLNLDRTYFSALFKKKVGLSPVKYLNELRLNQAADLIKNHGMAPGIAALSVGYADYCNFLKAFKKHFGCSPRAYSEREINA